VHDPARTVPRALLIAMVAITMLYLAVQIVTQGILGSTLAAQKTPLAAAAAVVMGPSGSTLILVGSIVSMFGYVSGMILAGPRMLFAFGRDGFLPAQLASIHARFKTPYMAIIAQTALIIALALTGGFERLAVIAVGTVLIMYAACCAGVIVLRRRGVQEGGTPFRIPFSGLVPVLAIAVIIALLTSLDPGAWKASLVVVGVAVVVYVTSLPSRRAAQAEGAAV
jgi:APA family basic amino acid/polyamine antiporter